ncbi:rcc01693 family protein [Aureimonas populi]|uniref:Rcc01693 family protein n=1 Tax=Aureimonas populi TaxID=1701758 RepID=A0ABW5CJU2_9HYPH
MSAAAPVETGAAAFPWDEAMALGLGRLRLAPRDFWTMTPRELARAMAPFTGPVAAPPTREALHALMRRFPDERR